MPTSASVHSSADRSGRSQRTPEPFVSLAEKPEPRCQPLLEPARSRRTPGISCKAVPTSEVDRRGHEAALLPRNGAAESFVSFIPSFGGPLLLRCRAGNSHSASLPPQPGPEFPRTGPHTARAPEPRLRTTTAKPARTSRKRPSTRAGHSQRRSPKPSGTSHRLARLHHYALHRCVPHGECGAHLARAPSLRSAMRRPACSRQLRCVRSLLPVSAEHRG